MDGRRGCAGSTPRGRPPFRQFRSGCGTEGVRQAEAFLEEMHHPARRKDTADRRKDAGTLPRRPSPGDRHGGGQGENGEDALHHEQFRVVCIFGLSALPVPLGRGGVLQGNQADLQLADFLGDSENAVRWQVWTALLAYLLQHFVAWLNKWRHQFSRMFTLVRAVLWNYFRLASVIECCDTPREHHRHVIRGSPETAYQLTFDWSA